MFLWNSVKNRTVSFPGNTASWMLKHVLPTSFYFGWRFSMQLRLVIQESWFTFGTYLYHEPLPTPSRPTTFFLRCQPKDLCNSIEGGKKPFESSPNHAHNVASTATKGWNSLNWGAWKTIFVHNFSSERCHTPTLRARRSCRGLCHGWKCIARHVWSVELSQGKQYASQRGVGDLWFTWSMAESARVVTGISIVSCSCYNTRSHFWVAWHMCRIWVRDAMCQECLE